MQLERIIDVNEFKFKITFQPEFGCGKWHRLDEWYAILVECPYELMFATKFGDGTYTLDKACEFIHPYLVKAVERWRKKNVA